MLSTLVSYSRDDAEFASRLAADLRVAGAGVLLAPLEAGASDRGRRAAEKALARCTGWLIVLSPAATRSESFVVDVAVATGRGIPIVVILCRDCAIPLRLRGADLVDFRTDPAGALQELLAKIVRPTGAPAAIPATPRPALVQRHVPVPAPPRSAAATAAGAAPSPHAGRALRRLGTTLLALTVLGVLLVLSAPAMTITASDGWQLAGAIFVIDCVLGFAGVKFLKRGKQVGALSAQAALANDRRAPVVYLRSFADDAIADAGSLSALPPVGGAIGALLVAVLDSAGGVASEEEQLAEAVRDVGPFVAIGRPGEKLPQLGAARMYVEDAEWQDVVGELMSRAALVVLRAGPTEGLWWEIETAARRLRPERVVLLLPYDRERYERFRVRAAKCFGRPLPDYPAGKALQRAGSIQGIVYFEPDGTPRFVQPPSVRGTAKPWVLSFRRALQPVFRQLGVDVTTPKWSVWRVLLWIVVGPIAAVLAVFLAWAAIAKIVDLF